MKNNYIFSVIIPARNEMFLKNTIDDLIKNKEAETEVIAVLDGAWVDPPIEQHPDVNIIYVNKSIGQRAATNLGVRLSRSKYVAKLDAHCSFDKGFDRKMIEAIEKVGEKTTILPVMRNLWAFDWECLDCKWTIYQDKAPKKCDACGGNKLHMKMLWIGKHNPQSTSYCFDAEPKFRYFEDWKHRPQYAKDKKEKGLTETMSIQGSCFMLERKRYQELNICDETLGSWGNQGIEVALKTRLAGGRVLVNHNTWYAHLFRTKAEFGFPWPVSGRSQKQTKENVKDLFWNCKWDKQIYPVSKVVEQFWPVKGWVDDDLRQLKLNEIKTKRSGLYKIKSLSNGRIYIGSAVNIANRIFEHMKDLKQKNHCNTHLQNTWDKYGEGDLEFSVLYFCKAEDLLVNEQHFIDEYKEKIGWDNMFNISPTAGSSLGRECSEETKEKISQAQMGKEAWNKGLTKETDDRVNIYAQKLVGRNPFEGKEHPKGMLGKAHSEETKELIGLAQRGIPKSEEHNRKNSEAHKGKIFTEEHRENLRQAQKELNRGRNEKGQYF